MSGGGVITDEFLLLAVVNWFWSDDSDNDEDITTGF